MIHSEETVELPSILCSVHQTNRTVGFVDQFIINVFIHAPLLSPCLHVLFVLSTQRVFSCPLQTASGFDQDDLQAQGRTLNTQNAPRAALPSSLSPLMRTPPNYFSGWSAGTQPELDPPRSDVTAMLMKAEDQ